MNARLPQRAIPFLLMRGGTSRGPFFNRNHLPEDRDELAGVLVAAVGSGHRYNIDGVGGGIAVTTKVAMLSRSNDPDADIDYFFAQVSVDDRRVDFAPTCGNMLAGVGPAAIEMGLIEPGAGETRIRIRAVNTGALVTVNVATDGGAVVYAGEQSIAGVPGTAAAIPLEFRNVTGSVTGKLLPTGNRIDTVCSIPVTCVDVAMPVVIARAESFGLTGHETPAELDANAAFNTLREQVRVEAGQKMGLGDVSDRVVPKFALVAPARNGGSAAVRYFMPRTCHPTVAVTGAQCLASALLLEGSVTDGLVDRGAGKLLSLEHPAGWMVLSIEHQVRDGELDIEAVSVVRTARLIARGEVYVPGEVWPKV